MSSDTGLPLTKPRASAFNALHNRNVQLYMVGMFVSQMGNTMQLLAEAWLVYQLTDSAFKLGLVSFVAAIALLPWMLFAGTIADRMSRRKLLAIAMIGEAIPAFVLAGLVLMGQAQVWHVVVVSIVLGAMGAMDFSSRMPLIQSMVKPDELESGFAIAVSIMNVARIIGPAVGGILIATVGVAGAFIFNGCSFLFALLMLALMKLPNNPQLKHRASLTASLIEVPLYILRERYILIFVLMVMVGSFLILPTIILLPVFARDILVVGPLGLGFLSAASGAGAVISGVLLASQPSMTQRRRLLVAIGLMLFLALPTAGFAVSQNFIFSVLMLILMNGAFVAFRTVSLTYVYMHTPDAMRGRLSSLLQIGMAGTQNVGGLFSGFIASVVSAPVSVAFGAALCFIFGSSILGVSFAQLKKGETPYETEWTETP